MSRAPLPGLPGGKPYDAGAAEREAADKGRLIESGWLGLRAMWIADTAPSAQIEDMRNAFFAGAAHLQGCLLGGALDPGQTETQDDLRRMDLLQLELTRFRAEFDRKKQPRPSAHIAAAVAGHETETLIAMDQVDRALRQLLEARGTLTAADCAYVLTFPLLHIARYSSESGARAAIDAMRVALDAVEEMAAKFNPPPQGAPQ